MANPKLQNSARTSLNSLSDYLKSQGPMLTVDADVHPTAQAALPQEIADRIARDPNYYHTRPILNEDLIVRMDQAQIDMALCWQNPGVLDNSDDLEQNAASLLEANRQIAELGARHPTRIIPAGWTDPKALGLERAIQLARTCVSEFGMPIVKMNPAQNAYPITDPMVLSVVDSIVETGAVPAFHFGADTPFTPTEGLLQIARRLGDHPVIGVHMGGGGGHFVESEATYLSAREVGLQQTNIFFVLSAKRDVHMESALISYAAAGLPASGNIAVASDAPYGNMLFNFGGFRALFAALSDGDSYLDPRLRENPTLFDAEMVQGFMGGNIARLVSESADRILTRCG